MFLEKSVGPIYFLEIALGQLFLLLIKTEIHLRSKTLNDMNTDNFYKIRKIKFF